jgi:catechol 2,3-dioxygenase-like lactoylglutathione lyase family enzyme
MKPHDHLLLSPHAVDGTAAAPPGPAMITGLSHVTFAVSDLERSLRFYADLVGLTPLVRWNEGAYLRAGEFWIGLLADRAAAEATNNSSYTHIAFAVPPETFAALREKLVAGGAEEWQPNSSPGESYYFLDPDGHKLEVHARTLPDRLAWLRQNPKPGISWF